MLKPNVGNDPAYVFTYRALGNPQAAKVATRTVTDRLTGARRDDAHRKPERFTDWHRNDFNRDTFLLSLLQGANIGKIKLGERAIVVGASIAGLA